MPIEIKQKPKMVSRTFRALQEELNKLDDRALELKTTGSEILRALIRDWLK